MLEHHREAYHHDDGKWQRREVVEPDETDEIADVLEDLKAELEESKKDGSSPEPSVIQAYLEDLIDITQSVIESPEASAQQTELQRLVSTLENLNQQVAK